MRGWLGGIGEIVCQCPGRNREHFPVFEFFETGSAVAMSLPFAFVVRSGGDGVLVKQTIDEVKKLAHCI